MPNYRITPFGGIDMADNGDVLEQIQKQLEGNTLGLSAVAEVLQKMDNRLAKAEDVEYEEDLMLAEEEQYEALIKGVAQEVIALIKADQEVGVNVSEKKVSGTKLTDSDADDGAETVTEDSSTANAADVIVSKADQDKDKDKDENDDEMREQDEIVNMKKQLEALQLQVSGYKEALTKSNDGAVSQRLERMGFREERGLAAPTHIADASLGIDNSGFLSKADKTEDVVEQLSKLSFKELRILQERVQSGNTEGIPTELLY
mgnify:CR=1 FL=1